LSLALRVRYNVIVSSSFISELLVKNILLDSKYLKVHPSAFQSVVGVVQADDIALEIAVFFQDNRENARAAAQIDKAPLLAEFGILELSDVV